MGCQLTDQQRAGLELGGLIAERTNAEDHVGVAPDPRNAGVDEFSSSLRIIGISKARCLTSTPLEAAVNVTAGEAADDIRAACHPLFIGIPFPWNQDLQHACRDRFNPHNCAMWPVKPCQPRRCEDMRTSFVKLVGAVAWSPLPPWIALALSLIVEP